MLKILQHSGLEKKLCYRTVARVNKFYILIRYSKIGCTFLFLQSPIYQKNQENSSSEHGEHYNRYQLRSDWTDKKDQHSCIEEKYQDIELLIACWSENEGYIKEKSI
jgi:hypothetical protein